MTPQIIYIILLILSLMLGSYQHGKEKEGKYNVWYTIFGTIIIVSLLYWGGFFDPILK